jgi:serine/threonine-protein kinase
LLYVLIVGRGPFAHLTDPSDLAAANVRDRPEPPSAKAQHYIPPALDAAVQRALEKHPADRFQSAAAFASALRAIAAELADPGPALQVTTAPPPPPVTHTPAQDARRTDPTLRLPSGAAAEAAGPSQPTPASADVVAPSRGRWFRTRTATFVAVTVLSAAISALLLALLSRVTP